MPHATGAVRGQPSVDQKNLQQHVGKRPADPLEVFSARCQARAQLWWVGEIDLHHGVDALQSAAVKLGLIQKLGQDQVQRLMAEAFTANPTLSDADLSSAFVDEIERVCESIKRHRPADDYSDYAGLTHSFARACKEADAEYLAQQNDPQCLRAWLKDRSADQRTAIRRHLEAKRCRSRESK